MCDPSLKFKALLKVYAVYICSLKGKLAVLGEVTFYGSSLIFYLHDCDGESHYISFFRKEQSPVVSQKFRVGAPVADDFLEFFLRVIYIGHIKEGDFHALVKGHGPYGIALGVFLLHFNGILSKAYDVVFIIGMDVVTVSGDLQGPQDVRFGWVFQVNDEERTYFCSLLSEFSK
ncbi:MAG: hypothetical protein PWQ68_83 [Thermoanaerobacteraceae bacterium]|nr:hypothetical protein [Thermoanaerobacteraceae bacterium]